MTDDEYMAGIMSLAEKAARHLCGQQNIRATDVVGMDDLTSELAYKGLMDRDKLEPRLQAGEEGYVFTALENHARTILKKERKHKKAGTPEDLDELYAAGQPRMVARKSTDPLPVAMQRAAARAVDRAYERELMQRTVAVFMAALDGTDREIFRLHSQGYGARAIALELDLGDSTVYRRLAAIKRELLALPTEQKEAEEDE